MVEVTLIQLGINPWILGTTARLVLVPVEPTPRIYDNNLCLEGVGVDDVTEGTNLWIFPADFGEHPRTVIL